MKYHLLLLGITAVMMMSCTNLPNEDSSSGYKNYGYKIQDDSLFINVDYTEFESFKNFTNHIETIACEGYIPKIRVRNKEYITDISISNPCFSKYMCVLVKNKNVITIHNDSIKKRGRLYPLDSLAFVIRRDVENYGKNPSYADHPKKLFFKISYDTEEFEQFPKTLKILTETYEAVTENTDIKIWIERSISVPPPPPYIHK